MGAVWPAFSASLQAVVQVVLIVLLGLWLSKRNYLDEPFVNKLASVSFNVLLPALLFSAIVPWFGADQVAHLWVLPVFALLHIAIGAALAAVLALLLRLPAHITRLVVLSSSFNNSGHIPFLLVPAAIRLAPQFAGDASAASRAFGYVSVYTAALMLVLCTLGYLLLPKPIAPEAALLPGASAPVSVSTSQPATHAPAPATVTEADEPFGTEPGCASRRPGSPGIDNGRVTQPDHPQRVAASLTAPPVQVEQPSCRRRQPPDKAAHEAGADIELAAQGSQLCPGCVENAAAPSAAEAGGAPLLQAGKPCAWSPARLAAAARFAAAARRHPAVNMPLGASLAGIIAGLIPPLQAALVRERHALNWLQAALATLGSAAVPLTLLLLGAIMRRNLAAATGAAGARVPLRAVVVAVLVKLVLLPIVGVPLVGWVAGGVAVVAGDRVLQLTLLAQAAMPAALTIPLMVMQVGQDAAPAAKILFWQYVVSCLTVSASMTYFLHYVS